MFACCPGPDQSIIKVLISKFFISLLTYRCSAGVEGSFFLFFFLCGMNRPLYWSGLSRHGSVWTHGGKNEPRAVDCQCSPLCIQRLTDLGWYEAQALTYNTILYVSAGFKHSSHRGTGRFMLDCITVKANPVKLRTYLVQTTYKNLNCTCHKCAGSLFLL